MTSKPKKHADPIQAQARRDQVLTAAEDCFARRGYHGAGMAEISKTAGMSAGHIYNYFTSKEAIIEAIIAKDMAEMFSVFDQLKATEGDLVDVMLQGSENGVLKHLDANRGALQLEMLSEAARNSKVAQLLQQQDQQGRDRLRDILTSERSLIKDIPEAEMASRIGVIFSLFSSIAIRKLLEPELTPEQLLLAMKPALKAMLLPFDQPVTAE